MAKQLYLTAQARSDVLCKEAQLLYVHVRVGGWSSSVVRRMYYLTVHRAAQDGGQEGALDVHPVAHVFSS